MGCKRECFIKLILLLPSYLIFMIIPVYAMEDNSLMQLKAMSLENLMQVTVFSASKKKEQLSHVAAAMHVITREDIRRSGARTLPDLLRGVPGIAVANMDAHTWAVTSRGFNGLFANKLLVLMDGRTLYTPLYSGVYWDTQDTLLEDIERIEIIRGPGAAIWGANAVNGVINIISRRAEDTAGIFMSAGGGTLDKKYLNLRYGKTEDKISYRIYSKLLERDNFDSRDDGEHPDEWKNQKGGFRIDIEPGTDNHLSFMGDIYHGTSDQLMTYGCENNFETDVELSGGNIQLHWEQRLNKSESLNIQSYMDRSIRDDGFLDQSRTTWDFSFSHNFRFLSSQDIIWGGGYRYTTDSTVGGMAGAMEQPSRGDEIYNLFVQDDWTMFQERLHLIIGTKMEHNDYTGYEFQPTVRMIWMPHSKHSFWAAVSRAVRTPSRADTDIHAIIEQDEPGFTLDSRFTSMTVPASIKMNIIGNPDFLSEKLMAYEIGYRAQPHADFSFDIALFYNDYKDLRTQDAGLPEISRLLPSLEVDVPITIGNNMDGETFGFELAANWQVNRIWQLSGTYSWLRILLHHSSADHDPIAENPEKETPEHQASLRSCFDLPCDLEWDTNVFYFDSFSNVSAHTRCDIRLGWNPSTPWELNFKVENLFDNSHLEFFNNLGLATSKIPRSWYAEVKYRF